MKKFAMGLLAYLGAFFLGGMVISLVGFVVRTFLGCHKIEPAGTCSWYSLQEVWLLNLTVLVAVTWFVGRKWYKDMEPLRKKKR